MNFVAKGVVCLSCGLVAGLNGWAAEAPRSEEASIELHHCILVNHAIYPTSFVNPYMRLLDRECLLDYQKRGVQMRLLTGRLLPTSLIYPTKGIKT